MEIAEVDPTPSFGTTYSDPNFLDPQILLLSKYLAMGD